MDKSRLCVYVQKKVLTPKITMKIHKLNMKTSAAKDSSMFCWSSEVRERGGKKKLEEHALLNPYVTCCEPACWFQLLKTL